MSGMAITWYELRDARMLSGWTQSQLAEKMGVSVRSVVSYERVDAAIPRKAEHAIRSVLAHELSRLAQLKAENGYESTATSDLSDVVALPSGRATFGRNPRLAGVTSTEMLRELLTREEELVAGELAPVTSIADVGSLSDDQLAEYAQAAGHDESTPEEFDEGSPDDESKLM